MNEFLYTAHITKSHGGLHFLWGEIGRQHVKAPLAAAIGPYSISPTHPLNPSMSVKDRRADHNTGNYVPYSCEQCVGSLTSHKVIMNKGCETGPTIYRPYPRRLESLTVLQMLLQRQHFFLSYLKTLSVGPAGV